MGKIIKLKSKQENVLGFLQDAIEKVKENNIDNVLIAFKLKQKDDKQDVPYVMTGYCNLDMMEKQELLGHIQIDIVDDMIKQNYLTN